jgi:hypothetical protein
MTASGGRERLQWDRFMPFEYLLRSAIDRGLRWTGFYSSSQLVSFFQSGGTRPSCRTVAAGRRSVTVPPLGLQV